MYGLQFRVLFGKGKKGSLAEFGSNDKAMETIVHPEILWAQRSSASDPDKNIIYLTVNLPGIEPATLECNVLPNSLNFKAKAGKPNESLREYAFDLELFEEVLPEESRRSLTTRHFALVLRKKENKVEYWPRLTKGTGKLPYVRTDFSKWVDEDEQDSNVQASNDDLDGMGDMGGGNMDFGGGNMNFGGGGFDMEKMMASMGSRGGIGSDDESEDKEENEDDGPPPLE